MTLVEIEQRILCIVQFWAPGHERAKKREFILEKFNEGIPEKEKLLDRHFRDIYADMKRRFLIGSHSDYGYFTICSRRDLELTLTEYDRKVENICVTKNIILNNYQDKYGTVDRQRELCM
jgi:hypothetical protein